MTAQPVMAGFGLAYLPFLRIAAAGRVAHWSSAMTGVEVYNITVRVGTAETAAPDAAPDWRQRWHRSSRRLGAGAPSLRVMGTALVVLCPRSMYGRADGRLKDSDACSPKRGLQVADLSLPTPEGLDGALLLSISATPSQCSGLLVGRRPMPSTAHADSWQVNMPIDHTGCTSSEARDSVTHGPGSRPERMAYGEGWTLALQWVVPVRGAGFLASPGNALQSPCSLSV